MNECYRVIELQHKNYVLRQLCFGPHEYAIEQAANEAKRLQRMGFPKMEVGSVRTVRAVFDVNTDLVPFSLTEYVLDGNEVSLVIECEGLGGSQYRCIARLDNPINHTDDYIGQVMIYNGSKIKLVDLEPLDEQHVLDRIVGEVIQWFLDTL